MMIELTFEEINNISLKKEINKSGLRINLDNVDFVKTPNLEYGIGYLGITRTTLVRLLKEEVEIDEITLKLER